MCLSKNVGIYVQFQSLLIRERAKHIQGYVWYIKKAKYHLQVAYSEFEYF